LPSRPRRRATPVIRTARCLLSAPASGATKALHPDAPSHSLPLPAALQWSDTSTARRPEPRFRARRQRSDNAMSASSGTNSTASTPRRPSSPQSLRAAFRHQSYSRSRPSGLRLPGVSTPWPLSTITNLLSICSYIVYSGKDKTTAAAKLLILAHLRPLTIVKIKPAVNQGHIGALL